MFASENKPNRYQERNSVVIQICELFFSFAPTKDRASKKWINQRYTKVVWSGVDLSFYKRQVLTFVPAILIPHKGIATRPEWPIL
jgi:hypothetical protein